MKSRHLLAFTLSTWWLATACGGSDQPGPTTPTPPPTAMSALARAYLDTVVNVMQANSMHRKRINWTDFRQSVLATAPRAQTIQDTYPAITAALALLADGHSQYRGSNGAFLFVPQRNCAGATIANPTVPSRIGYVRVGTFGGSGVDATNFATDLQSIIRISDSDSIRGWIVDVRGNGGGNMWPMVAGVGPILGEGINGYFVDPDSVALPWSFSAGASRLNNVAFVQVASSYTLKRPLPRVAVLIDGRIASSGEATVIAFKGRANTRFFGTPTCGLSTANQGFLLPDGALLILTVSVMADRNRTLYGSEVLPDERITDPAAMVARAIEWLETGR